MRRSSRHQSVNTAIENLWLILVNWILIITCSGEEVRKLPLRTTSIVPLKQPAHLPHFEWGQREEVVPNPHSPLANHSATRSSNNTWRPPFASTPIFAYNNLQRNTSLFKEEKSTTPNPPPSLGITHSSKLLALVSSYSFHHSYLHTLEVHQFINS